MNWSSSLLHSQWPPTSEATSLIDRIVYSIRQCIISIISHVKHDRPQDIDIAFALGCLIYQSLHIYVYTFIGAMKHFGVTATKRQQQYKTNKQTKKYIYVCIFLDVMANYVMCYMGTMNWTWIVKLSLLPQYNGVLWRQNANVLALRLCS